MIATLAHSWAVGCYAQLQLSTEPASTRPTIPAIPFHARHCLLLLKQQLPGTVVLAVLQAAQPPTSLHLPTTAGCVWLRCAPLSSPDSCALAAFHSEAGLNGMCGAVWCTTVNVLIQKW